MFLDDEGTARRPTPPSRDQPPSQYSSAASSTPKSGQSMQNEVVAQQWVPDRRVIDDLEGHFKNDGDQETASGARSPPVFLERYERLVTLPRPVLPPRPVRSKRLDIYNELDGLLGNRTTVPGPSEDRKGRGKMPAQTATISPPEHLLPLNATSSSPSYPPPPPPPPRPRQTSQPAHVGFTDSRRPSLAFNNPFRPPSPAETFRSSMSIPKRRPNLSDDDDSATQLLTYPRRKSYAMSLRSVRSIRSYFSQSRPTNTLEKGRRRSVSRRRASTSEYVPAHLRGLDLADSPNRLKHFRAGFQRRFSRVVGLVQKKPRQ